MSPAKLKYISQLFLLAIFSILSLTLFAQPVFASSTITSVTLNGSTSVNVAPSASITAVVNVTTIAGGSPNWQGTSWTVNGVTTCVNTPNNNGAGSYSESFTITAPAGAGSYNASFIAYSNNACSSDASTTFTLTNGIVVGSPTNTPAPTPTPTSPPAPTNTPVPTTTTAPGQPTSTPAPTTTTAPGQPTSTSAPGQPSSTPAPGTTAAGTTYYPSISLNAYSPNPTNQTSLSFSGTTSIAQGNISQVEYTFTEGAQWIQAQFSNGNFSFTTPSLAEGIYTIKVRAKSEAEIYTPEESYASQTITIATTPPQVTLNKITPNPTKNQTPILAGTATSNLVIVTQVEVSINGGTTWQLASRSGSSFTITLDKLEDGNYPIIARAFDNAGNIGQSDTQTLIVDTIPPIIGGGMQALGPQILTPDQNGMVSIVSGAETTIATSMKGGVTEAEIKTGSESFQLAQKEGTNIWVGKIEFDNGGEKPLTISAVDGAGNSTIRPFNTLIVENAGIVENKETKQGIENAEVSVYFFETISQQWILWEAESYGQHNPQKTASNGAYSFMLPSGKYYIEAQAAGYNTLQSEIITASQTSILNYTLALTSKPKIELTLPVFGKVILTVPSFSPPETFSVTEAPSPKPSKEESVTFKAGTPAPNFSLSNLEDKNINLTDFKGKKLLLSFIAPWSSLSLEQTPFLSQFSSQLEEDQAVLVVSLQESTATTQTLMKKGNYTFPVVADKDGKTAAEYKITILPQHIFIDENGLIQETYTGVLTTEELQKKLSNIP